ncbi:hypothetical protein [Rhodoplanes sp. Z2-YC6860]|uniref:hypothetical protein n=1 Tax=Rhodoplanes sp. Z2-YC6860 TaxID=674703 RepID=UPI0012ED8EED|nr:hypothetical protein [Rhodoplanes sp. Z2-YC6860]
MSDFHHDSNVPRNGFDELGAYEKRIQWAAAGVLLLLCAGIFALALLSGGDTQTAMNSPTAETTGSAANLTAPPPQLRK